MLIQGINYNINNVLIGIAILLISIITGFVVSRILFHLYLGISKKHSMSDTKEMTHSVKLLSRYIFISFIIIGLIYTFKYIGIGSNTHISYGAFDTTIEDIFVAMGWLLTFFVLAETVSGILSSFTTQFIKRFLGKKYQKDIQVKLREFLRNITIFIGIVMAVLSTGIDSRNLITFEGYSVSLYSIFYGVGIIIITWGFNRLLLKHIIRIIFKYTIKSTPKSVTGDSRTMKIKINDIEYSFESMLNIFIYIVYMIGTYYALDVMFVKDTGVVLTILTVLKFFSILAVTALVINVLPLIINIFIAYRNKNSYFGKIKKVIRHMNNIILIIGILIGLQSVGININKPIAVIGNVPITIWNFIMFFIIIVMTLIITRVFISILKESILSYEEMDDHASQAIEKFLKYTMEIIGVAIALTTLGLDIMAVMTGLGLIGFALAFGMQDAVANLIAGILLSVERPFSVGDRIKVGETWGDVVYIGLRSTKIKTTKNELVIVPNMQMSTKEIWNYTKGDKTIAMSISIGVNYSSDWKLAKKIIYDVAYEHPLTIKKEELTVLLTEFGASALNFTLWVWIKDAKKKFVFQSDILEKIKDEFDKSNIDIPYPQIVVHNAK